MIQRNPLLKSLATVFLFWYVILFLPAWLFGAHVFLLPQYLLYGFAVMAAGAMLGFFIFLGLRNLVSRATESAISTGGRFRQANVLLGRMPTLPSAARKSLPRDMLSGQPWWNTLEANFPAHARAVKAVLEVMHTRPDLPASPVPGGHGGRTLIAHSMAVAREIIGQAKAWVYEGQKDRRGKVRVALNGDPHRFGSEDIGLLILTGLAHDIGKLTCYQDAGHDSQRRRIVREVQPNHDTAGARLLRTVPEVMELPYADRLALLTAVGYYHHPYALPRADWITDRMRSLTELLILADVETGRKEGHTLTHDYALGEGDYSEDAAPAPVIEIPMDDDDDSGFFGAAPKAPTQSAQASRTANASPSAAPIPRPPAAAPAMETEQLPYELDTFLRLVRKDGAINGRNASKRIAWKVADRVYVMEPVLRRQVAAYGGLPPTAIADDLSENNGNAAPFTAKLLEQLASRKALVTTFDGQDYAPARAVFMSVSPKGGEMAVFIVKTTKVPGAGSIPDAKPMAIRRPLWGEKRPKVHDEAPEDQGSSIDQRFLSDEDTESLPLVASPAKPVPPSTLPPSSYDSDFPFDLPVQTPPKPEEPAQERDFSASFVAIRPAGSDEKPAALDDDEIPSKKSSPAQGADSLSQFDTNQPREALTNGFEPKTDNGTVYSPELASNPAAMRDALPGALTQLLASSDWQWPVETIEKSGESLIVVDVESAAGAAITSVLQSYQQHGVPIDRVRIVTRKATQKRAYVWPKID